MSFVFPEEEIAERYLVGRKVFFSGGPNHGEFKMFSYSEFRWKIFIMSMPRMTGDYIARETPLPPPCLFSYVVKNIVRNGEVEYIAEYQGDGGLNLDDLIDA